MRTNRTMSRVRFRSGNALLDLAFVMPLLIGLTFGAMEYGYALYIKHTLQSAAREGARAAIVAGATTADVQTQVDATMSAAGLEPTRYNRPCVIEYSTDTKTWSTGWSSAVAGNAIRVTVSATWGAAGVHVLPTIMGGIPTSKQIMGATVMRKEG